MIQFLKCFYVELKKGIRELPFALLGIAILGLIIGAVAFCATKLLYQHDDVPKATVAVVTDSNGDSAIQLGMLVAGTLENTSFAFDYLIMNETEAADALRKHSIIGIIYLPNDLYSELVSGTSPSVNVIFSTDNALSAVLLTEVTRAAAKLLACEQASVYAADDIYSSFGNHDAIFSERDTISIHNFNYVLNRARCFTLDATKLHDTVNIEVFYLASALIFILFFITTTFSAVLKREGKDFYGFLFSRNISSIQYLFARICSLALIFFLLQLTIFLIAMKIPVIRHIDWIFLHYRGNFILFFLCTGFLLSAYANAIFLMAKDISSGILISYCVSSIMILASGCMIPTVFFPDFMQKINIYLPAYRMHKDFISLLENRPIQTFVPYCIYIAVFFLLCFLIFSYRRRSDRL